MCDIESLTKSQGSTRQLKLEYNKIRSINEHFFQLALSLIEMLLSFIELDNYELLSICSSRYLMNRTQAAETRELFSTRLKDQMKSCFYTTKSISYNLTSSDYAVHLQDPDLNACPAITAPLARSRKKRNRQQSARTN